MPSLSFENIGVLVVGLILLTRWLWDYERSKRDAAGQHEPRANPPLHKEYITRSEVEKIEKTLKEDLTKQAGARKKMHEEVAELQGDVKVLKAASDSQTRQLSTLDHKMDQVLYRLPRP